MTHENEVPEISLVAELTDNGVKAAAKSRALSALDRLVGSVFDVGAAHAEAFAARRRAVTTGEVRIIDAQAEEAVAATSLPPALRRDVALHFRKVAGRQDNKDAVGRYAIEDLIDRPPDDHENFHGPDSVSEDFLNKFERAAEDASSEELRMIFGKILAGEVRRPGTFSAKVLRVASEVGTPVAGRFRDLSRFTFNGAIFKPVSGELSFADLVAFVTADLIVDPGLAGHLRVASKGTASDGEEVWFWHFENRSFGFSAKATVQTDDNLLHTAEGSYGIPIYLLTDAGASIRTILDADENETVDALAQMIQPLVSTPIMYFIRDGEGWRAEKRSSGTNAQATTDTSTV